MAADGDQLQAFLDQDLGVDLFQLRFARAAVGQEVHRQVVDFLQVAIDDPPALGGLGDVRGAEAHLDDIRAAAKGLEDVLDRMGQRGGGFADGGETLGLKPGVIEPGVGDGHAGLQADGGQKAKLVGRVGVILDGAVDVDDAEDSRIHFCPRACAALIGTHRALRMPRLWTLFPAENRRSAMALLESTPSPLLRTWLMMVREAWIFSDWGFSVGGSGPIPP